MANGDAHHGSGGPGEVKVAAEQRHATGIGHGEVDDTADGYPISSPPATGGVLYSNCAPFSMRVATAQAFLLGMRKTVLLGMLSFEPVTRDLDVHGLPGAAVAGIEPFGIDKRAAVGDDDLVVAVGIAQFRREHGTEAVDP